MVFELNLYKLAHKTYDLFSKGLQKYMKDVSTMVTDWPDNYVRVILLNSNKDQKILHAQANEFI